MTIAFTTVTSMSDDASEGADGNSNKGMGVRAIVQYRHRHVSAVPISGEQT